MATYNNLADLSKYFKIIQPSNLLGKYQLVDFKNEKLDGADKSALLSQVVGLLINTGENQASAGIPTLAEIVSQLNNFVSTKDGNDITKEQFNNFIRVYSDNKISESDTYWKGDRGQTISWTDVIKTSTQSTYIVVMAVAIV